MDIFKGGVTARNFPEVKAKAMAILSSKDASASEKLAVGNFFFKQFYSMYKPDAKERKRITKRLVTPFLRTKSPIPKGAYLQYNDQRAMLELCKSFYIDRFTDVDPDRYFVNQLANDTMMIKYLYLEEENPFDDERLIKHFVRWILKAPTLVQQSNLLDVLLLNYKADPRTQEIYKNMRFSGPRKDVYADGQNVHDEEIAESALMAASRLMAWAKTHPFTDDQLRSIEGDWNKYIRSALSGIPQFAKHVDGLKIIEGVVVRVTLDHTQFSTAAGQFSPMDVMIALIHYIDLSPNRKDFYPMLFEEFQSMVELCASGYIERMVTVLQGAENGAFDITISEAKRLFAIVSSKITKASEKITQAALEGTIDPVKRVAYYEWIATTTNAFIPTLDPDTSPEMILDALDEYCQDEDLQVPDEVHLPEFGWDRTARQVIVV